MTATQRRLYLRAPFAGVCALALLAGMWVAALPTAQAAGGDWPTYLADANHSGFNGAETIITPSSAPRLHVKWTHSTGGHITAQPAVANGVVYWGSWDGWEHATALDNHTVWATWLGRTNNTPCPSYVPGVVSTAAVATVPVNGTLTSVVFVGGGNAVFYALNALNGRIVWQTRLGSSPTHFIWSSPAVYNGSVYIGMSSFNDCPLVQGQLIQLNASTGAFQHVFKVVPNGCTGGTVWGSPTVDTSAGTIYVGTGGVGSCSVGEPYASSLMELRTADLSFVHHWQVPASQNTGDGDFGSTPTLFTATINGTTHQMVGIVHKNGYYYAFDRAGINAGYRWRTQVAIPGSDPFNGQGSISPSAWDGTSLYVAGGNATIGGVGCQGSASALNPSSGAFVWRHCLQSGPVLGAVSAVPGVVVVGQGASIAVLAASNGATLFGYHDGSGQVFWGAPSIANGVLYQGNMDGTLFAFTPS